MSTAPTQLDRRISEHLDGQLTGQQQAELYRELLRDPDARAVMDAFAENDKRVHDALRAALHTPARPFELTDLPPRPTRRLPWRQLLATAAMLALAAGAWFAMTQGPRADQTNEPVIADAGNEAQPTPARDTQPDIDGSEVALDTLLADLPEADVKPWWRQAPDAPAADRAVARPVLDSIDHGKLDVRGSVLGVIDHDNETVYWLQVQQFDTTMGRAASEL